MAVAGVRRDEALASSEFCPEIKKKEKQNG